jgi:16S rRNA (guanine527-N7)-methyltransferase
MCPVETETREFVSALESNAAHYDVALDPETIARLAMYFNHVQKWNRRLHLVAPTSPAEFATRHILESLFALKFISTGAHVVDVGSGAGLPIIPCMIVRPDIRATLFEASARKTIFLHDCIRKNDMAANATIHAERFQDAECPDAEFLTCRALDNLTGLFPTLLDWSAAINTHLLFGGENLRALIEARQLTYSSYLLPQSERRFLFLLKRL